jgi:hypothetical protein
MRAERRAAVAMLLAVVAFVAHGYGESAASVTILEQSGLGTTFEVVVPYPGVFRGHFT